MANSWYNYQRGDLMKHQLFKRLWFQTTILFICLLLISFVIQRPIAKITKISLPLIILCLYLVITSIITFLYLHKNDVFQSSEKMTRLNHIFYELIKKTVYMTDSEELYQTILNSAIDSLPMAQKGCIMILDPDSNLLHFAAVSGYDMDLLKKTYLRLDQTFLYRESKGNVKETVMIDNPFEYDRKHIDGDNMDDIIEAGTDHVLSTLSTPIFYQNRLYGMINVDSMYRNIYTDEDKEIIEIFALEVVNVLKLFSSFEQVNYFMNHDALTKIYNRRHFNEKIEQCHQRCLQEEMPYVVISIDLNLLKETNDRFGHHIGDLLLTGFTKGLSHMLPEEAIFARYGGDEFIILLPNWTHEEANNLMIKVNTFFDYQAIKHESYKIPISYAYGISAFPQDNLEYQELIKIADHRMYDMKQDFHEKK